MTVYVFSAIEGSADRSRFRHLEVARLRPSLRGSV